MEGSEDKASVSSMQAFGIAPSNDVGCGKNARSNEKKGMVIVQSAACEVRNLPEDEVRARGQRCHC